MEEIYSYVKRNRIVLILACLSLVLGGYLVTHHSTAAPIKNELTTTTEKKTDKSTAKAHSKSATNSTATKLLVVDIQGAVKNPGVYRLKNGSIVQEALKMAGGPSGNADIKQVNQAKRITDQMQIYIPVSGEKQTTNSQSSDKGGSQKVVNINTATVDDFKDVSGIGPKKAEKIIAFREKNGDFKELHDLTKVSGIGEKSLDSLKDQLTV